MNRDIYYVGLNANNAICNDSFFRGSITLFPTGERGNISYYSHLGGAEGMTDGGYETFVNHTLREILSENPDAEIMCFNAKAKQICADFKKSFAPSNSDYVINFLNNKDKCREYLADTVPELKYHWIEGLSQSYEEMCDMVGGEHIVIQGVSGAGGDNTYNISSAEEYDRIGSRDGRFCVSRYTKNTPLNVTAIIGEDSTLVLPLSAQLITAKNNNFGYAGGDFVYPCSLDKKTTTAIDKYTRAICNKVSRLGYRGIMGIDYILTDDGRVYFMEINPRFQSSSFAISRELEKGGYPNIAELNYRALSKEPILSSADIDMGISFVNCNENRQYPQLGEAEIVTRGYCKDNPKSIFRKVYDRSIIDCELFEHY